VDVVRHPDGAELAATVVSFDPDADIAVLRVPGIDRPPLPLGDAEVGDVGGVFGHPGGGPLEVSPYEVGRRDVVTGRDIFGADRIEREVLFLAAELRPGDSGGALVDPDGAVAGMAFAIAPDRREVAFAVTSDELAAALGGELAPTGAGRCLR
jgi:S1-C subfamily serine protease